MIDDSMVQLSTYLIALPGSIETKIDQSGKILSGRPSYIADFRLPRVDCRVVASYMSTKAPISNKFIEFEISRKTKVA